MTCATQQLDDVREFMRRELRGSNLEFSGEVAGNSLSSSESCVHVTLLDCNGKQRTLPAVPRARARPMGQKMRREQQGGEVRMKQA